MTKAAAETAAPAPSAPKLTAEERVRAEVAKENQAEHFRAELERLTATAARLDEEAKRADAEVKRLKAVTDPTADDHAALDALNTRLCGLLRNR